MVNIKAGVSAKAPLQVSSSFLIIQPLQCGFSFVLLLPSFRFMADSGRFSSRILLNFAPFIVPSILTSLPVPADEKQPLNTMLDSRDGVDWVVCSVRFVPDVVEV